MLIDEAGNDMEVRAAIMEYQHHWLGPSAVDPMEEFEKEMAKADRQIKRAEAQAKKTEADLQAEAAEKKRKAAEKRAKALEDSKTIGTLPRASPKSFGAIENAVTGPCALRAGKGNAAKSSTTKKGSCPRRRTLWFPV